MNVYRDSYTDSLLKFRRCDFFPTAFRSPWEGVEEDQREFDECIPGFAYR